MIIYVVISLAALVSYAGPFILVFRRGLKGDRPRLLFFLYLLDMLLLQVAYLLLSLADSKQEALLWYTFNIVLSSAQAVIYFFFTRAFLGLKPPHKWMSSALFAWLSAVMLGAFLEPDFLFADVSRYKATGLFVPEFTWWGTAFLMPMLLIWGLIVFYLGRGHQSARSSLQRVRIQYVLLSILVVWVGLAANAWSSLRPYPIDVVANIVGAFLIAHGILRYQLLDINIVIRKWLSYLISVAFIGMGYFFTILVSTRFLQNLTVMQLFFLSLATAILTIVLSRPIVDRAQLWIDQFFFREKYGSNLMIQRLSRTAASVLDLEKLAGMILDDLTQTLHIRWAAFFLEQENKFRLAAQSGPDVAAGLDMDDEHPVIHWLSSHETTMTTDALDEILAQNILLQSQAGEMKRIGVQMFIPLRARDRLVGVLSVGPKLAQQRYSQDDELTLATLANQVAIAIDNARLYQTAQQELVERQHAEAALRESEQRYRLHFENVSDVIFSYDTEFRVIDVSPSVMEALGYTPDELIGKSFSELGVLTPESLAVAFSDAMHVMRGERITASEYQFIAKDGTRKQGEVSGAPFVKADEIVGVISVARDITERKRAEAEREALIAELKAKTAEMERFTYAVSHDLKSPLITIKGFLGFLEQDALAGKVERMRSDMAHLNNAADKMQQLLNELLELSRIGRLVNPPQAVSMTGLAHEAAELVAGQLVARGVQVDIAPDMPTVVGDRPRLREVYENLLSNAAKFMGDQAHPRVEIGVRQDAEQTVFTVRDNGIGIAPQDQDRIFELFEKLDAGSEGTGIGLAIVKRIVETHGGKIWIESEGSGHGSTFCFTLAFKPG